MPGADIENFVNMVTDGTSYGANESARLVNVMRGASMFACEFYSRETEPHLLLATKDMLGEARLLVSEITKMLDLADAGVTGAMDARKIVDTKA